MNERIKELIGHVDVNSKIKELAEQSGCTIDKLGFGEGHLEKFAELIVRECLNIVKSNTYGPNGEYDYSYSDENAAADERAETIYKEIAYSFGVQE